jgi:heavy metal translocating P-type ATPase
MWLQNKYKQLLIAFKIPLLVLFGIILYGTFALLHLSWLSLLIVSATILLGTYSMIVETVLSIMRKQFALDYIAILAIVVSLVTQEYLVAAILALMICSGSTLEAYGVAKAKKSLTQLIDRIPTDVTLWENGAPGKKKKLKSISIGDEIFIKKGEVIALDGEMLSERGETDESSLTGEPYYIEKEKEDIIRSGTINVGQPMIVRVTKTQEDSTYRKIIAMVKRAENEKSPMVRLADKYSTIFTWVTLAIGGIALVVSHFDLSRVLAVLAIATPCPLIIATPIALLGGVNASAKRKIIIKRLAALEVLSRVQAIVFDKTGTITLGKPEVVKITLAKEGRLSEEEVLGIAESIERNSLHPLAKALVHTAKRRRVKIVHAKQVHEIIGVGISGIVDGKSYLLSKIADSNGMEIGLFHEKKQIATFHFEDEIKAESKKIVRDLHRLGLSLHIFTGDKENAARKVVAHLGESVIVQAEMTPAGKRDGIEALKKEGFVVGMVGDGINDAPALALADVGMAFSNQEQTAASEAADIVFLGGDFSMVYQSWKIAKRTILIAKQSILWGIGLSVVGMVLAMVGLIPPLVGAGLQEVIDVAVILNALRASR